MPTDFTVCVYSIFRDESDNVDAWAATTVDADERFVLDTGSQDDTVTQLMTSGVPHAQAIFDPFRFDDARNASLAIAPEADLYLKLDADERLPTGWRKLIEDVYDPATPRYRYRLVNRGGGSWGMLVRNDLHRRPGFRWRYPCHEVLVGPDTGADIPDLLVENLPSTNRGADYVGRYLELLQLAVAENPSDHRMSFYLAREYWYRNQWDRCRQEMTRFLGLPGGWAMERAEGYRILAAIDTWPDRWLWHAVGEAPDRREPWVDLVRFYLRRGDVKLARAVITFAEQANDESLYTTQQDCWGYEFDKLLEALS